MANLQAQTDSLSQETQALRKENALLLETVGERLVVGFEVQIGAFEHFDINAYDSELLRLQEIKEEGNYEGHEVTKAGNSRTGKGKKVAICNQF